MPPLSSPPGPPGPPHPPRQSPLPWDDAPAAAPRVPALPATVAGAATARVPAEPRSARRARAMAEAAERAADAGQAPWLWQHLPPAAPRRSPRGRQDDTDAPPKPPLAPPPRPAAATAPAVSAAPAAVAAVILSSPETIHPALWRAHQLGRGGHPVEPSGYPSLDAELPGGGWPQRALTELLLPGPGQGEIRLLAPVLARLTAAGRGVLLLGPPAEPCAPAWGQLGIQLAQCVFVRGHDLLWPMEQALRSGQVGALLAWPGATLKADALRRLQLAAQSHDGPAFLFRPLAAARQPSPAPLRLALQPAGPDALAVRLLKRRGPAREEALVLELPTVLPAGARERAHRPRVVAASSRSLAA